MATIMQMQAENIIQQQETLRRQMVRYMKDGYRVVFQTPTTAQMVKAKRFNWFWFIFWWFSFGIIYLLYYWGKQDSTVYLTIDPKGNCRVTKG